MAKPCDTDNDWEIRKDRIIGLGERSFHKSYYPQLKQNLDRLEPVFILYWIARQILCCWFRYLKEQLPMLMRH